MQRKEATNSISSRVGEGVTSVYGVINGLTPMHAVERQNLGGYDQTKFLQRILLERGVDLTTSTSDFEIAREIKASTIHASALIGVLFISLFRKS